MATHSGPGKERVAQQLLTVKDGGDIKPSLSSLTSPTGSNGPTISPLNTDLDFDHELSITTPSTVVDSVLLGSHPEQSQEVQQQIDTAPLPPRPSRNGNRRRVVPIPVPQPEILKKPASAAANAAENRRQNVEVPAVSRVYPNGNVADFSPWRGKHLEDNISEHTIKSGFQNKPLITNESNTARPALWSHLKNKGGTSTLSSLFVSVLDKRQISGRISGPSTFKPPPRVTMSNSRREAFLQELANPAWPMRKLNRSVPHTISGRVLLDQCLSKNIPIPRATWLAKCIGANDFRAFKRKVGTGSTPLASESKWIRDWTIHVEQFLHAVLTAVGETDWRTKVDYALRLSCHLFDEKLLDHEHYLDWVLASVQSSDMHYLPMWLLLAQIHWNPLVSTRKRGSRLAKSLLNHHLRMKGELNDQMAVSMLAKLEDLIVKVARTRQECLILPGDWLRFRTIVQLLSEKHKGQIVGRILGDLLRRNDRLALSHSTPGISSAKSKVIQILDSLALKVSRNQLVDECTKTGIPTEELITLVLRWASSKFRQGRHRIYVASRVLQKLLRSSREPEMSLCNIMQNLLKDQTLQHLDLFQVVVELVRSNQFSVGRFVQYLVVTGANTDGESAFFLTLLRHLPTDKMSESTRNMYDELLVADAENLLSLNKVRDHIDRCFTSASIETLEASVIRDFDCDGRTLAQKFELGHAVRNHVLRMRSATEHAVVNADNQKLLLNSFLVARGVLEAAKELPCLADVLGFHLASTDQILLTHVTYTLHYHHASFIAMGAMKPLFDQLMATYEQLRHQQQLLRPFCAALLALSTTLNANTSLVAQISQDIVRCEQLTSIAMCSPVSDNAGEVSHLVGDADDDIEKVLSSGTTMETSLLHRIFQRVVDRMDGVSKSAKLDSVPLANWLSRLRDFNRPVFDQLLRAELSRRLRNPDALSSTFDCFAPVVVASSCMTLGDFAAFVRGIQLEQTTMDHAHKLMLSLRLLHLLLPDQTLQRRCAINVCHFSKLPSFTNMVKDAYKVRLEQMNHATTSPSTIFDLVQIVTSHDDDKSATEHMSYLKSILESSQLSNFVLADLARSDKTSCALLDIIDHANSRQSECILILVERLLLSQRSTDLALSNITQRTASIFARLNELSLKVDCLALELLQHGSSSKSESRHNHEQMSSIVLQAILNGPSHNVDIRLQLLSNLRSDSKAIVAREAEQQLLSIPLDVSAAGESAKSVDRAKLLLTILERTYIPNVADSDNAFNSLIVDKLRQGVAIFSSETAEHSSGAGEASAQQARQLLRMLLRTVVIRKNKFSSPKTYLDEFLICSYLLILLQLPQLQMFDGFLQCIYDTAVVLVDDLTDEQRSSLARSENWHVNDSRIAFLLGPTSSGGIDAWLGLVMSQSSIGLAGPNTASPPGNLAKATAQNNTPQPNSTMQQSMQQTGRTPMMQQTASNPARLASNAPNTASSQKTFLPPAQFPLKHWELLPDQGNTGLANDTAISLAMFSTRKV